MRRFLFVVFLLPSTFAAGTLPAPHERRLRLFDTHSRERIDVVYRRGDAYVPEALARLDHFLRDRRLQTVANCDPRLFDLLADLVDKAGRPDAEIHVICGYRTPWSNEFLRGRSRRSGVAVASLHMKAEAVDIRVPGVRTSSLRDAALALGRGGVGYYAGSDFLHVDIGRVRRW
jgi:uncharacterized protein YcbK (DUF882 family)